MTTPVPAVPTPPEDLTARVFRTLYPEFDLHDLAGTYLAVPAVISSPRWVVVSV